MICMCHSKVCAGTVCARPQAEKSQLCALTLACSPPTIMRLGALHDWHKYQHQHWHEPSWKLTQGPCTGAECLSPAHLHAAAEAALADA